MRTKRLVFIFLAFYFIFLGGNLYYIRIFPIRLFHHIFVTIIMALWLFRRARGAGLPYTPLNRPIYFLVVVWFITAFTGIDSRMSFEYLWFMVSHAVIFFVAVDLLQSGRQKMVMEMLFIISGVIIIITGLEVASWYFGLGYLPDTDVGWFDVVGAGVLLPMETPRVFSALQGSTHIAGFVAPLITVAIGWALTARRKDYRQALFLLAALLTVVLVLAFTRGGLMSLGAGLSVFMMIYAAQRFENLRQILPKLSAVIVVVVAAIVYVIFSIGQQQERIGGDKVRADMYESAVEMFIDYPVFGVGPSAFGRAFREYRTPELAHDQYASAHDLYLNIAAETGFLGIIAVVWLGVVAIKTVWQTWQAQSSPGRKLRVGAVAAALFGIGVHNLVDYFTLTSLVMMMLMLVAYSITGYRSTLDERPKGQRLPAMIMLLIVLGYGIFFIQADRAHIAFLRSLSGGEDALEFAQTAADIDPGMNLYDLQIAYILGLEVIENEDGASIEQAIEAYEYALQLEPTWDIGWINLAALYARNGDLQTAISYLDVAHNINPLTPAILHMARLLEESGSLDDEQIIDGYSYGIRWATNRTKSLPLSDFWVATPLRREGLERYIAISNVERQYRILVVHDADRAYALVSENPQTAAEYWVAAEYTLTVENDPQTAVEYFSEAIDRDSGNGNYYVSRARANSQVDPDAVNNDLYMAALLGTRYEYPNLVRANFVESQEEINEIYAVSLPPRVIWQAFETVLYGGRSAQFELFPEMRFPGPGRAAMQPWYSIAKYDRDSGDIEHACLVYEAIMNYAPDETEAHDWLGTLDCADED